MGKGRGKIPGVKVRRSFSSNGKAYRNWLDWPTGQWTSPLRFQTVLFMFPGIQGSAKFPGNSLRRISRGKGVADSIDYLAAGKEFLGHFRTQKNRESPGWASVLKIEEPLDVVLTFWQVLIPEPFFCYSCLTTGRGIS